MTVSTEMADIGPMADRLVPSPRPDAKEFSTLQAVAALQGFQLNRLEDDFGAPTYLVSRWALTKDLPSLAAVRAFLVRVGGSHAG